jgi:hypothetical protein
MTEQDTIDAAKIAEAPAQKTPDALRAHITDQLAMYRDMVMSQPVLPKLPENPEQLLNMALKTRGVNRAARRAYLAKKRKPGKAQRK